MTGGVRAGRVALRSADLIRCLVMNCASDARCVEVFNRACGTKLQAPITVLLDPQPRKEGEPVSTEDHEAALFLGYVLLTVWPRVKQRLRRDTERAVQRAAGTVRANEDEASTPLRSRIWEILVVGLVRRLSPVVDRLRRTRLVQNRIDRIERNERDGHQPSTKNE
jgi:hypothetical protein